MRVPLLLATLALLPAPPAAQLPVSPPASPTASPTVETARTRADLELAAFFDAFDKAQLARSPQGQSYRGIRTDYGKWNDNSDAAELIEHQANQQALAEMRARFANADLGPASRLSYRLFEKQMARRAAGFKYRHDDYVFDQMNGAQSGYPAFLINIHQVKSVADAEACIARLQGLGPALEQDITTSENRARGGVMPPKWVYPYVIEDARNTLSGAPFDNSGSDSPLLADIKAKVGKLDIAATEREALVARATAAMLGSVKPAYAHLIAVMQGQESQAGSIDGVWRFKDGADFYAANLATYTTTGMTAAEIHQLGLEQVKRIHGEMLEIAKKTGFKGTLPEFFTYMRANKDVVLPDTPAGRADYLELANGYLADISPKLPAYFLNVPKSALVVKAVEPFREKSAGKAFYQSPAEDGSRPGTVYVNLYKMNDMPTIEIEPLIYHEGMPGHHFERANSAELKNVPAFRKFGGFTAYSEGWGL